MGSNEIRPQTLVSISPQPKRNISQLFIDLFLMFSTGKRLKRMNVETEPLHYSRVEQNHYFHQNSMVFKQLFHFTISKKLSKMFKTISWQKTQNNYCILWAEWQINCGINCSMLITGFYTHVHIFILDLIILLIDKKLIRLTFYLYWEQYIPAI